MIPLLHKITKPNFPQLLPHTMLPITSAPNLRLKSGRKPLQPKNSHPLPPSSAPAKLKPKLHPPIHLSFFAGINKENHPICLDPAVIQPCDSSLADELNAIKKKLERLRLDRDRTEKMLRDRDMVLELQMKELLRRGQVQRELEIEVDRLFRLQQLRAYSMLMTISPIRSLREKERDKIITEPHFPESEIGDGEESVGENSSLKLSCDSPESGEDK